MICRAEADLVGLGIEADGAGSEIRDREALLRISDNSTLSLNERVRLT